MAPRRSGQPGFLASGPALRTPPTADLESGIETLQRNGITEPRRSVQLGFSANAPALPIPPLDDLEFGVRPSIPPSWNPRKRSLHDASQQLPTPPFPDLPPTISGRLARYTHQSAFPKAGPGGLRISTPGINAGGGMDCFQTPTPGLYQFQPPTPSQWANPYGHTTAYNSPLDSPAEFKYATPVPTPPMPFEAKPLPDKKGTGEKVPCKNVPGKETRRSTGARAARARAARAEPPLRSTCDGCFKAKVKCHKGPEMCKRCASHGFECRFSPTARANKGKPKVPAVANPQTAQESDMAMNSTAFGFPGMGYSSFSNTNFDAFGVCNGAGPAGYTPPASESGEMSRSHSLVGGLEVNAARHYGTMPQGLADSLESLESNIFGPPLELFDVGSPAIQMAPIEGRPWEPVANHPPPVTPGLSWEPGGDSWYSGSEVIAGLDDFLGIAPTQYTGGQQQNPAPWEVPRLWGST